MRGPGVVLATAIAVCACTPLAEAQVFPPRMITVAGTGSAGVCSPGANPCAGDGGPATAAFLKSPNGTSPLPSGGFLIADTLDQTIRKVSASGVITTVAGNGQTCTPAGSGCGDNAPATSGSFDNPQAVVALPDGSFFVADAVDQQLRWVTTGGTLKTFYGNGMMGDIINGSLRYPTGITAGNDSGHLLLTEYGGRVDNVDLAGGSVLALVGPNNTPPPTGYSGDTFQAGGSTQMNHPARSSELPGSGGNPTYLIADTGNNVIRMVSGAGIITTVAGSHTTNTNTGIETGMAGYSGDGGPSTSGLLSGPQGVAALPGGGYLIADTGNNVIRQVSASGTITTVAGSHTTCPAPTNACGDGGPATAAALNAPLDVQVLPNGGYLIADANDNRIREVEPPVTLTSSIATTPASPNGQNGWFRSAVQLTVSASISSGTIAQTRCALDLASAPADFSSLPTSCPYLGAGATLTGDGVHTVYAASDDGANRQESPLSETIKIDSTPPVVTCPAPPALTLGRPSLIVARVSDSTSGPLTPTVSASADTRSLGRHSVLLTGSDVAGNVRQVMCGFTVTAPRLTPFATWTFVFRTGPPFTTTFVGPFTVTGVAGGASVRLTCAGPGCPFAVRLAPAAPPCPKSKPSCKRTVPKGTHTVQLGSILDGKVFRAGASLSLQIYKQGAIGKSYLFKFRRGQTPTVTRGCMEPGSLKVKRSC